MARFWIHWIGVERRQAAGGRGESFAPRVDVLGYWPGGSKLTKSPDGETDAKTTAKCAFPAGIADIPLGSRVTAPAHADGKTFTVDQVDVGEGPAGSPNHIELTVT